MKITGTKKLKKQLMEAPKEVRKRLAAANQKSASEALSVARVLISPSSKSGKSYNDLFIETEDQGLTVAVQAAKPEKEDQIRAGAIEFGRKKGDKGTTTGKKYLRGARAYIAKKHLNRIRYAIRKGLQEAVR